MNSRAPPPQSERPLLSDAARQDGGDKGHRQTASLGSFEIEGLEPQPPLHPTRAKEMDAFR